MEAIRRYVMEQMGMTADVDIEDDSDKRELKDLIKNSSLYVRCHQV